MRRTARFPHIALVYDDQSHRNRSIQSYLESVKVSGCSVTMLSGQAEADRRFMCTKSGARMRRSSLPATVIDVKGILEKESNPSDVVRSIMRVSLQDGGPSEAARILIGDWDHLVYDNFEVGLAAERASGKTNNICCYRREGFWSLEPKHIAEVFEIHHSVFFNSRVLRMAR